ncbi:CDP-alcohol phosphatidyltransferase family protein [Bacteroidetes/Chlorobi group bacterium Naka2016]|jgi:cardiolipin synthase|nr:MAG: CDP-alcohol phosphatidyltransferase family protein [Bacteroidetes/Chlorobi group bacterium Naka2016]
MTIPNILSAIRLVLAFVIGYLLFNNEKVVAIILILIAWVTDLLDGYLARKTNKISELGKILDPLADKLLVLIIVISLVSNHTIAISTASFVIGRDLIILIAGLNAAKRYKFVIPSNIIGKVSAFLIGFSIFLILVFSPTETWKYNIEIFIDFVAVVSLFLYSFYYFKWLKKLKTS